MEPGELWDRYRGPDWPDYDEEKHGEHLPILFQMQGLKWVEVEQHFRAAAGLREAAEDQSSIAIGKGDEWRPFATLSKAYEAVWSAPLTEARRRVMVLFARHATSIPGLVPTHVDAKSEDFVWSRCVAVLSILGHEGWPEISSVLRQQSAWPYGGESKADWAELVDDAVRSCGWPVTLPAMPAHKVAEVPICKEHQLALLTPLRIVALIHLLKHAVLSSDGKAVITVYRGQSYNTQIRNAGESFSVTAPTALSKLGMAVRLNKNSSPFDRACVWVASKFCPKHLIQQRGPVHLPPSFLHGPWTSTISTAIPGDEFFSHGSAVAGVWRASNGKVSEADTSDELVLHTEWDHENPFEASLLRSKRRFQSALPSVYVPQSPFTSFRESFPNLETSEDRAAEHAILFDAPLYAELLRPFVDHLDHEFPIVAILPTNPTLEDSTNQGKSEATRALARAVTPGIDLCRAPESTSAPDLRSIAAQIRRYGTIALDEWIPPTTPASPLAHDNLQALCTGASVQLGEVLSNDSSIRLQHGIVASAKALPFPDDMVNRSFPFFLSRLTDAQRDNADNLERITSGRLSIEMRLGAWADIESNDIAGRLEKARRKSTSVLRFPALCALIGIMCEIRGVEFARVMDYRKHVLNRFYRHTQEAEEVGLLRQLYDPQRFSMTVQDILGMGTDELGVLKLRQDDTDADRESLDGHLSASHLLALACSVLCGAGVRRFADLLPILTDQAPKASNRAIERALLKSLESRLPPNTYVMASDDMVALSGWAMARFSDVQGVARMRLINVLNGDLEKYELRSAKEVLAERRM